MIRPDEVTILQAVRLTKDQEREHWQRLHDTFGWDGPLSGDGENAYRVVVNIRGLPLSGVVVAADETALAAVCAEKLAYMVEYGKG